MASVVLPRSDVVTLGEAMLRLSPPGNYRLEQTSTLELHVGGAELSAAIAASRLGLQSSWVTKLPRDALGRRVARLAKEHDVDLSHVVWTSDGRVGVYYVEFGTSPRTTSVIYDRKGSVTSTLAPGEVDWSFLKKGSCFHTTGISLAISESFRESTLEAIRAATKHGCMVCLDVNYRSKLWTPQEAARVITPIAKEVDLLIASDAGTVWGLSGDPETALRRLRKQFPKPILATSVRKFTGLLRGTWASIALVGEDKLYRGSREFDLEVVDRIGAGDSFAAGLIFGLLRGDVQMGLDYGDAMASLKHSIPGDANYATREEVEELIASGSSFRIKR